MIKNIFIILMLTIIFPNNVWGDDDFCPLAKTLEERGQYTLANSLYDECARKSQDPISLYKLASNYYSGKGFRYSNYKVAASLFEQASNLGYVPAQLKLGILYWRGEGVSKDLQKAYYWLYIASKNGDSSAKSYLSRLASELSPEHVDIAVQNAESWLQIFKANKK